MATPTEVTPGPSGAPQGTGTFPTSTDSGDIMNLVNDVVPAEEAAAEETPAEEAPAVTPTEEPTPTPESSDIPEDLLGDGPDDTPAEPDASLDDVPEPDGLDKAPVKTQDAFKAMRLQIKELKALVDAKPETPADETTQARVAELEGQLEQANFVKSPRFEREFVRPIKTIQSQLIETGKEYGLEEATIQRALQLKGNDRLSLLSEEVSNQGALSEILPMFSQYQQALARANQAVADYKEQGAASEKQHIQEMATRRAAVLAGAEEDLFKSGFTLIQKSSTNPNWLPGLRAAADNILKGEVKPEAFAKAALAGVVAQHQIAASSKQIASLRSELESTRTQLGKYVKLQPRVKGSEKRTPSAPAVATTIEELVAQTG